MANPLFDRLFGIHAGKSTPFLHLPDGQVLTHTAFLDMAARLANALTGLELEPGDRVAVQVEKSPEALALFAACAQTGLIFLPLNTAYTTTEKAQDISTGNYMLKLESFLRKGTKRKQI